MARLLYVTYGAYRVGLTPTSSAVELEDRYSWDADENSVTFSFQVLITASTPTLYETARAAFEAAILTPDQALTVVMDSNTVHSYDPSANTGLNPRGSVRKVPGRHNTARSGRFVATITLGLPMDASGRAGRRSARVQIFVTPSGRKRAVVEATYTAATSGMGGVAGARATYEANMATFVESVLSGIGGTWEQIGNEYVSTDQNDKVANGVLVYEELKYNQGVGALDVAAVKQQSLVINRRDPSINDTTQGIQGSSWSVRKLQLLEASYDASIDFSTTTDLTGLWTGTILPRIDESVADQATSTVIRSSVTANFDPVENRISARVTYLADVGGAFQQMRESLAEQLDEGNIYRPVWDGEDFTAVKYKAKKSHTRTLTRQYVCRRGAGGAHAGSAGAGAQRVGANVLTGFGQIGQPLGLGFVGGQVGGVLGAGASSAADTPPDQGPGWDLVRTRDRETPFTLGEFGSPLPLEGWVRSWVWIRVDDISNRPVTGGPASNAGGTRTR